VDGLKNLAAVSMFLGDTDEVERIYKRLRRLRPFDLDVRRIGSFLQDASGKNEVAGTGENVRRPRLWNELSDSLSLKWRYRFAFDLEEARKLTNQSALVLIKAGRTDDAIRFLNEFLELDDQSPEIHYNLAQFYNFRTDIKRTLIHAGKAVELQPDFFEALDLIGNVFFTLGDYESSRDYYSRVLEIDPGDAMGLYNLGCVYSALEDQPEAEKYWLEAAAREHQNRDEAAGEKTSGARLAISLVVIGRKVGIRAHMSLGHLYAGQDRPLEAVTQYHAAEQLDPGDPRIHFELGRLYVNLDKPEEARRHLEKSLYLGGTMESEVRRLLESMGRKKK
jgi:tetratricopeptide (TPR) repeat protein